MPEFPSGTVAFLFTDIEGSTSRWETRQEPMRAAVQRHFALLEAAVSAEQGVVFKTIGDAVQAAFPTVPRAVAAAIAAQAALQAEDWGDVGPLRVRMAIHAGSAAPRDGDYLAPALNRLARVLSAGYGGQVLLTEAGRALATMLPDGYGFRDLGRQRLRDLLEAENVYQIAGPGLEADFPPLKSLDQQPNNLPAQPTALIGREIELAALHEMIATPGTRLVTLTGPGGTGKSRLALQAAAELLESFPDGAWFVPLASASAPELVPDAIATVLKVREVAGEPLMATLAEFLRSRRLLLVLDNLEQVIEAGPLIGDLLGTAPQITVIATSREPLRLRIEREFPIAPLAVPAGGASLVPEQALTSPAVQLFVERAKAVSPSFEVNETNFREIVAICQRIDGLPLAIELAAARVRVLSPSALLSRLDRGLSILTGGARDLPERQQTLRATIAWSHDLLPPEERTLFARLGIFAGGCTFESAEQIAGAGGGLTIDLFAGLDSLLQKNLVRREEGPAEESRFTMLETIREFAREQLAASPDIEELRQTHAEIYLALAEQVNWDEEDLANQIEIFDRLEADHANLRQAIGYFRSGGAAGASRLVRLAAALAHFWWVRGHFSEGREVLGDALSMTEGVSPVDRAHALSGAAQLAEAQWELDRARELHTEALALRRGAGDAKGVARSLTGLAVIARNGGDLDQARALHQEALDIWRATGDAAGESGAMLDLGVVSCLRGDYAHAVPLISDSLVRFTRIRDMAGAATAHQWLGIIAATEGDFSQAIQHFTESIARWREIDNLQMIAMDLANLGEAHYLAGAASTATPLLNEAVAISEQIGDPAGEASAQRILGRIALQNGDVPAAVQLLLGALRQSWDSGDRGVIADILDALAEAALARGDREWTAMLLRASDSLRAESGIKRPRVYARRHVRLKAAVVDVRLPATIDVDETISRALVQIAT